MSPWQFIAIEIGLGTPLILVYVLELSIKIEHQHVISCRESIILQYYICTVYQSIGLIQYQIDCGTIFVMTIHTELAQEVPINWELLYPFVNRISHIYDVIGINGDPPWWVESAIAISISTKF